MLLDTDANCPVCGSEAMDVGPAKQERQPFDEVRIAFPKRRGSRIGCLISVIVGGAVLYFSWQKISGNEAPGFTSEWGNKLIDIIYNGLGRK
jgi:hypothetical protein